MHRFLCIHGHFYQPPRENPWLEAIEAQESAYPYHDWNERITAECYAPNATCRILDGQNRIVRIVNNYERISFNFGPTLLSWMETKAPDSYAAIIEADRKSRDRYSGHGNALAQVYNHAIMPLCNERDRRTQVRWGLADFEHRFGRPPEGMWLAETAVDLLTLDLLAEHGLKFTVLSPYQAMRARVGDGEWDVVVGGRVDPTRPYSVTMPSGRPFALFFYDGPISQAIAFEGLLKSGEKLAARLLAGFSANGGDRPQLVHVATDGETYGHHHTFGDMALAYALSYIEANKPARLTNYGEYLELHPPTDEVEIIENSTWSCSHGVERWKSHCGCNSGGRPGWTQTWRGPLRAALDTLRDRVAPLYEAKARDLFPDPWGVRDDYARVILDRRPETGDGFLRQHAGRDLAPAEAVAALKLLELQRNCLLMYTSCGWFFDELSGIETVQVIAYAARAVQLAEDLFGQPLEAEFLDRLSAAKSNVPQQGDGRRVYERIVLPLRVNLAKVAAHFAVSSLFEEYGPEPAVFCYTVRTEDAQPMSGKAKPARLNSGRLTAASTITRESADFCFAAVHLGDLNLRGGVVPFDTASDDFARRQAVQAAFDGADLPEVLQVLDRDYAAAKYSLRAVFRDEQRKILCLMLDASAATLEALYRQVYVTQAPTMMFLQGLDSPVLPAFQNAARFILNLDLRRAFEAAEPNLDDIRRLADEASLWGVALDDAGLAFALKATVTRMVKQIRSDPADLAQMKSCVGLLELVATLSFRVDFWLAQNDYYQLAQTAYPERQGAAQSGDPFSREWLEAFTALGERLRVRVSG